MYQVNKLVFILAVLISSFGALSISGCQEDITDVSKQVEGRIYDGLASGLSSYCGRVRGQGKAMQQTRVEVRREVRQRGMNGPPGPVNPIEGLDDKTAYGEGPLIFVYCDGDDIPPGTYETLVKDWEDLF